MRALASFAGLQLGWFACVLGATHGVPWLGPMVVLLTLVVHVLCGSQRAREVALLVAAACAGFVLDSALLRTGLTRVQGASVAPPWLVMLWPNFMATTAPGGTLAGLARRPWLAAVVGAIGGPLAYASGARLGAMTLASPVLASVAIAVVWAAFVPLALLTRSVATRRR